MDRLNILLIVGIIAISLLILGCTGVRKCEKNEDCLSWQTCNLTAKKCVTAPGFCTDDGDCNSSYQTCDRNKHICVIKKGSCLADSDCEEWQECDNITKACKLKFGYCTDD
ncbi:MAG: hypothetical protein QW112_03325, partial [Candidatus Micrarchaeia archaeon]